MKSCVYTYFVGIFPTLPSCVRETGIRCRESYQWLQETITMRGERTTMSDGRIIVKESQLHERGQRELKVVCEYSEGEVKGLFP